MRKNIILTLLSIFLAGFVLLLICLDPTFYSELPIFVIIIWIFCTPTSCVFVFQWLKNRNFLNNFQLGLFIGASIGLGSIFLVFLFAPLFMVLYYIEIIRNYKANK